MQIEAGLEMETKITFLNGKKNRRKIVRLKNVIENYNPEPLQDRDHDISLFT